MNIKRKLKSACKLIRSPKERFMWLAEKGFYNRMPDEKYLKRMYRFRMGHELNLENPKAFSEKMEWLKIHDRKPIYTTMVDKYLAKDYVAGLIGEEHIIPTLGVWDRFEDIDFDALPNQFVLKCTHDSGGLVVCRDKSRLDIEKARRQINQCLKRNFAYLGREWPYMNVKPRVIAEQYMEDRSNGAGETAGLSDYKFFCFNGVPRFLYLSTGLEDHATARMTFLNMDWTYAGFRRADFLQHQELPPKPEKYDEMIRIAEKLSQGMRFLRVDLYEINGKVYFGELTFYTCGGYMLLEPPEWDEKLGAYLQL